MPWLWREWHWLRHWRCWVFFFSRSMLFFFAGGRVACRLPELSEELCVSTTSEGGRLELLVSSSEWVFFCGVLGAGMFVISLLFVAFAAIGYFAFGEETQGVITTNLGPGLVIALVQLGLCINLFFTFSLMMNLVYKLVERHLCDSKYYLWLRWLLVLGLGMATGRGGDGFRYLIPIPVEKIILIPKPNGYQTFISSLSHR